jgi:hypothetical protein
MIKSGNLKKFLKIARQLKNCHANSADTQHNDIQHSYTQYNNKKAWIETPVACAVSIL